MEITKRLAITPLGGKVEYRELVLIAIPAPRGCSGCAFDNKEGARYCGFATGCMAHFRQDGKPVRFVVME